MRSKRSGRAPGRPCEPFRAIQGAHATEAAPNESCVSIFEGLPFFYFFALWAGLSVAWPPWIALKGSQGRPGARPDRFERMRPKSLHLPGRGMLGWRF